MTFLWSMQVITRKTKRPKHIYQDKQYFTSKFCFLFFSICKKKLLCHHKRDHGIILQNLFYNLTSFIMALKNKRELVYAFVELCICEYLEIVGKNYYIYQMCNVLLSFKCLYIHTCGSLPFVSLFKWKKLFYSQSIKPQK